MPDDATPNAADNTASAAQDEAVLTPGTPQAPAAGPSQPQTPETAAPEADSEAILKPGAPENANEYVGAPENYSDFTLPEGFSIDDNGKKQVSELFRGLNLSQKGGQKLIDAFTERITAQREADLNALAERRREWRNQIRQRPAFASERALAKKGLDAVVRDPEEVALFTNSWMQDHPAVFSMFVKVGRLLGEDTPLPNGASAPAGDSALTRFPIKVS